MKHEELYYGFDSEKQKPMRKILWTEVLSLRRSWEQESNKNLKTGVIRKKNDFILEGEK